MEPFKNILVGLDNSPFDQTLIKYASFIAGHSTAEKVQFIHIIRNVNIPAELKKEFPHLVENAIDERKKQIKKTVAAYFKPANKVQIIYQVKKGNPPMFVDLVKKLDADLIIIGQKSTMEGTGVTTLRLARRASCNLLIVPENTEPKADKLLVPVDFSSYSKLALDQAIDFSVKTGSTAEIICQNVYTVPAGYHYTGKSFEEFAEIMKKNAQESYVKFMKKIKTRGIKITDVYSLDTNDNLASDIYDLAEETSPDFVIIGAKGRTAAAALFLGSLAEKMVNEKMKHPLLVVRFKGKNAGVLETLREI